MSYSTKSAMKEMLKKTVHKKPIEKIKISEITDGCGISRMTFYYHFKDIYDLVEWSLLDEAKRTLGEELYFEKWQEGYYKLLFVIKENSEFVTDIYRSIDRVRAEDFIKKLMVMTSVNTDNPKTLENIPECGRRLINDFYTSALMTTMINWIQNGMKEDPKYIVKCADILVNGGIENAKAKLSANDEI